MSLINLLPQDYYQRRQGQRTNIMCGVLFAVVMVGIVSASMVSRSKGNKTQTIMDDLNRSYNQAAQTISQMQTLKSQKQAILDKWRRIQALQDPVSKSVVLAVLTNARPDGVSLLNVKLDSHFPKPKKKPKKALAVKTTKAKAKTPAVPPAPEPQIEPKVSVEIIGLAGTDFQVARYLANLTDSGLTQSVDLSYTQDYKPSSRPGEEAPEHLQNLREFRLTCRLNMKIDAQSMSKRWRFTKLRDLTAAMNDDTNKGITGGSPQSVPGAQK
jgi:Tfp pilus assembly protein PilN